LGASAEYWGLALGAIEGGKGNPNTLSVPENREESIGWSLCPKPPLCTRSPQKLFLLLERLSVLKGDIEILFCFFFLNMDFSSVIPVNFFMFLS
jgi:hypothetical protein